VTATRLCLINNCNTSKLKSWPKIVQRWIGSPTRMAGASLLTLLDDISVILDDVSIMTKVAAKNSNCIG